MRLWERAGRDCEWERPRAPAFRLLWDTRATDAVVQFLGSTGVGCRAAERVLRPREEDGLASGGEEEEGGPGSPYIVLSFVLFLCPLSFPFPSFGGQGSRRLGCPRLTRSGLGLDLVM